MKLETKNLYLYLTLPTLPDLDDLIKLNTAQGADVFLNGVIECKTKEEETITTFTVEDILYTAKTLHDSITKKAENYKLLLEDYKRVRTIIAQLHSLCCIMAPDSTSGFVHF